MIFYPGYRHDRFFITQGRCWCHSHGGLTEYQNLRIICQSPNTIYIGRSPNVFYSAQNRMVFQQSIDQCPRALFSMYTMMIDPCFSKNLLPVTAFPSLYLAGISIFRVWTLYIPYIIETVGRCAQGHYGFTGSGVFVKIFHLLIREFSET